MTYQSHPWSAVDAIINAGRDDTAGAHAAESCSTTTSGRCGGQAVVQSRDAMMLSSILHACPPSAKPCIQFVAAGEQTTANGVAIAACGAAAAILGPSLLLNARMDPHGREDGMCAGASMPDAFIAGLFHHYLANTTADLSLVFGRGPRTVLNNIIDPFSFVAIDNGGPHAGPAAAALAAMCTGTVLVVRAGRTSHAAIKDAALQITRAGGRIIGSVLDQAPASLPSWIRRP